MLDKLTCKCAVWCGFLATHKKVLRGAEKASTTD